MRSSAAPSRRARAPPRNPGCALFERRCSSTSQHSRSSHNIRTSPLQARRRQARWPPWPARPKGRRPLNKPQQRLEKPRRDGAPIPISDAATQQFDAEHMAKLRCARATRKIGRSRRASIGLSTMGRVFADDAMAPTTQTIRRNNNGQARRTRKQLLPSTSMMPPAPTQISPTRGISHLRGRPGTCLRSLFLPEQSVSEALRSSMVKQRRKPTAQKPHVSTPISATTTKLDLGRGCALDKFRRSHGRACAPVAGRPTASYDQGCPPGRCDDSPTTHGLMARARARCRAPTTEGGAERR